MEAWPDRGPATRVSKRDERRSDTIQILSLTIQMLIVVATDILPSSIYLSAFRRIGVIHLSFAMAFRLVITSNGSVINGVSPRDQLIF